MNKELDKYRSIQERLYLMECLGDLLQESLRDYENKSVDEQCEIKFKLEKLVKNLWHVRCELYELYDLLNPDGGNQYD